MLPVYESLTVYLWQTNIYALEGGDLKIVSLCCIWCTQPVYEDLRPLYTLLLNYLIKYVRFVFATNEVLWNLQRFPRFLQDS